MANFSGIVEFVTVAEAGGFSAAAHRLGLNVSQVSRRVAQLEARLGVTLLLRSTRVVKLTEAGRQYFHHCQALVEGLDQATENLQGEQSATGRLRVSMAGEFAELYVVPILFDFLQEHAELSLDLNFDSRSVNFIEDGFDFAIRYGPLKDSALTSRRLAHRSLVAVASRTYIEAHGTPKAPEDLVHHQCIVANNPTWTFLRDGVPVSVQVSGRWQSNTGRSVAAACRAGFGIAYLPRASIQDVLADPSMVPVLEPYWQIQAASWIVYANRPFLPLRSRLAIDYLIARFKDWHE